MTIFGLGIHILIAIFFAIHAVRSGRELYWLVILFMFPLFGSIVYFAVVFLPQSRVQHGLRKAGNVVQQQLDPGRALRAAQQEFDLTPTAHNQMRLAQALLDAGQVAQAVAQYDACLRGPFANDPEINLAAARARLANGQARDALALLLAVRGHSPNFRPEQLGLLLAQAYAADGQQEAAGAAFAALAERYSSIEVRAEYALWALAQGEQTIAAQQLEHLAHARKHMTRQVRALHQDVFRRVDQASAGVRLPGA